MFLQLSMSLHYPKDFIFFFPAPFSGNMSKDHRSNRRIWCFLDVKVWMHLRVLSELGTLVIWDSDQTHSNLILSTVSPKPTPPSFPSPPQSRLTPQLQPISLCHRAIVHLNIGQYLLITYSVVIRVGPRVNKTQFLFSESFHRVFFCHMIFLGVL